MRMSERPELLGDIFGDARRGYVGLERVGVGEGPVKLV